MGCRREAGWALSGVSGEVVLVAVDDREALVIKRPRERLAVAADWMIARDRAFNEVACLQYLGSILPVGSVPRVRFVDRKRYLFAMEVLPAPRSTWKEQLFAGTVSELTAIRVADLLALMHRRSSEDPQLAESFTREDVFVDARIDPFHREVGRQHPELAAAIEAEIDRVHRAKRVLTWGDASPKNVFVYPDRVCFFDVEIAHWGDPAFDVAYFLTHLILKATVLKAIRGQVLGCAAAFWAAYQRSVPAWDGLEANTLTEVGCLLLARIEGKSPAAYVRESADQQAVIALGSRLVAGRIETVSELLDEARRKSPTGSERVAG
jgi:aminoglycoside phosphotransferase (APT) family kinase protein